MGPGQALRKIFRKQGDWPEGKGPEVNDPDAGARLRDEKDDLTKD
jgi:hypothetical protein